MEEPIIVDDETSSRVSAAQSVREYVVEFLKICLIAAAIILPIRFFVIQPFSVKGSSMEPNFYEQDYLIVDELTYKFRDPQRGEVVIFRYPATEKRFLIKRVIGLPGDTVEIRDSVIKITNAAHPQGFYLDETSYLSDVPTGDIVVTVDADEYFVLGDNRIVSYDSEKFGPIARNQIVGKAIFRGMPLERAGLVTVPTYSVNGSAQ